MCIRDSLKDVLLELLIDADAVVLDAELIIAAALGLSLIHI